MSLAIEEERGRGKVEGGGVALTNCHFAGLKAMMSLSHGLAKFSGRAKQRKGGNLAHYDLIRSKIPDQPI